MKLKEITYKRRSAAQAKADEWQAAFPHLKVMLDWQSADEKFRIRVENPKTGTVRFLSAGKA